MRLFVSHPDHWYNHLLQADTAMLKSIPVIIGVIIIIIWITKEAVPTGKYKRRIDGRYRQSSFPWIAECQYIFGFIIQVAAMFIPQVGGSLFITDYFIRRFYPHRSMIGSEYNIYFFIGNFFQCLMQR